MTFVKDPVINVSITLPVNPPGTELVLTAEDLWAGLLHSQRYAQEYVPHVTGVEITNQSILSDTTASYKRICHLDSEIYPDVGPLEQDITVINMMKIESYTHTNNTLAITTMSYGDKDSELYYSLSYERPLPGVKAESKEAAQQRKEFVALGRKNIALCLDLTRKYKVMGKYDRPIRLVDGSDGSSEES